MIMSVSVVGCAEYFTVLALYVTIGTYKMQIWCFYLHQEVSRLISSPISAILTKMKDGYQLLLQLTMDNSVHVEGFFYCEALNGMLLFLCQMEND
jgi:small basic protein